MKTMVGAVLVFFIFGICVYASYAIHQEVSRLREANKILETTLEEKNRHINNWNLVCNRLPDPMGHVVKVDCGESFVPRRATCACTLWCLEDYNFITSNRDPEQCLHK